ncbi:MAG: preprotein translocase subunit SecE [Anaerolineae bacterium]
MTKATGLLQAGAMSRLIQPVVQYLRDTRAELRKVTWPTRQEAWNLTLIVLAATAGMAAILGLADFAFAEVMKQLILGSWVGYVSALAVVAAGVLAWYLIQRE